MNRGACADRPRRIAAVFAAVLVAALSTIGLEASTSVAMPPLLSASAPSNAGVGANLDNSLTGMALVQGSPDDIYRVSISTDLGALSIGQHDGIDLAAGYDSWTGQTELAFTGYMSDINSALGTVTLNPFDNAGDSVTVSINAQRFVSGLVYSPTNGHYYEFVPSEGISWNDAHVAAGNQYFAGSQGYLASIPSAEINSLIAAKIPGAENAWFGAHSTDAQDSETFPQRNWHWTDGPLAGTTILECANLEGGCDVTGGPWPFAELWAEGEPNNVYAAEDAAVTNWGIPGRWNDLPSGNTGGIAGYVVEYGDLEFGSSTPFYGTANASATIPIGTTPNAPGSPSAEIAPNSNTATVSWDEPVEGADGYTVTASPGGATCHAESDETSCTITDLTWGTAYTFSVASENEYGLGSPSDPSDNVTPLGPPSAPLSVEASQDHGVVTVSWETPANDGGSQLIGYTVAASPGDATCTAMPPTTSCQFEGLTLGTEYTFSVTAENENSEPYFSEGPPSDASNAVTPVTVPSAPQNVEIESATDPVPSADGASRSVSWTAPESDGGLAIESYTVTAQPGDASCTADAPATTCDISGLAYGEEYAFSVAATNEYGTGSAFETEDPYTTYALPGSPVEPVATTEDGEVSVSWSEPDLTGGRPVTSYTVSSSPEGASCTATAPATSCSPTPVVLGTEYTFSVTATTLTGTGAPSDETNSVTPVTKPSAPTNVIASTYHDTATLQWDLPESDGGLPINSYTVVASPGGNSCTAVAPTRTCTVEGLTYGTPYTFSITASNELGAGDEAGSSSVTPTVVAPGAPSGVAVVAAGPTSVKVSWTPPSETGGAPVSYVVTSQPGGLTCHTDATTCVISGLSPSVKYVFVVSAFNSAGGNALSNAISPAITLDSPLVAGIKLAKKRVRPSVRDDQKLLKRLKPKRLSKRRHYVGGTTLIVRTNKAASLTVTILRKHGRKWAPAKYEIPAVPVRSGLTRIKFTARFRGRPMTPGSYRMTFALKDGAGNTASPRPISFKLIGW